jgi:hypothetical protein
LLILLAIVGCEEKKGAGPAPGQTDPQPKVETPALPAEVSGSIRGKAFQPDHVALEGHKLSFTKGKDFFPDLEITFDLPGPSDAPLAGKEWTLGGANHFDHPFVQVANKEGQGLPQTEFVNPADYSLTLKITKQTPKSVEGTIDLRCSKPPNTRLTGRFSATIARSAADRPDADDAPFVFGRIAVVGKWEKESLTAGFVGTGPDRKIYSNGAGTTFTPGDNSFATSTTFKPQLTSIFNSALNGPGFKHVRMAPGDYLLYVRRGEVLAAWQKVTVKAADQLTVDLTVDSAKMGSVEITLPDEEATDKSESRLYLVPQEFAKSDLWLRNEFTAANVKAGEKKVVVQGVPAGKYRAMRGKSEAEVEVAASKSVPVTLVRSDSKK